MTKTIYIDYDACVGCGACTVACMDQNDLMPEEGHLSYRPVYQLEKADGIHYLPLACLHCPHGQCRRVCPTGALHLDESTNIVLLNQDLCNNCHDCIKACPYQALQSRPEGGVAKCQLCYERVVSGFEPACVRACPFDALSFEDYAAEKKLAELMYIKKILNINN